MLRAPVVLLYRSAFTTITIRFSGTNFVSPLFRRREQRPPTIIVFSSRIVVNTRCSHRIAIIHYYCAHQWGSCPMYYTLQPELGYIPRRGGLYRYTWVYTACALGHAFSVLRFNYMFDDDTATITAIPASVCIGQL